MVAVPHQNKSHIMHNFEILGQLLKIPPLSARKCHSAGSSGVPEYLFYIEIPVNPVPEFQFLVLAKPKLEIGIHRIFGRNIQELIFKKCIYLKSV